MDLNDSVSVTVTIAGVNAWILLLESDAASRDEVDDMFKWLGRVPHWTKDKPDDTLTETGNRKKLREAAKRLEKALQPYLGTVEKTEELLRRVNRRDDPESANAEIIKILHRFLHRQGFARIADHL